MPPFWIVLFSLWFLGLAVIRGWEGIDLLGIPSLFRAILLVAGTVLLCVGLESAVPGIWLPVCVVLGTCSGLRRIQPPVARARIGVLTVVAVVGVFRWVVIDYVRNAPRPQPPAAIQDARTPPHSSVSTRPGIALGDSSGLFASEVGVPQFASRGRVFRN